MMIAFLLFVLTILASSVVVVFYKSYTAAKRLRSDLALMIFWSMAPLAAVYAGMALFDGFEFNAANIITGLIAGVCNILAVAFLIKAMAGGSMTVAVIIINLNFIIPIVLSLAFLRESVSPFQITGILLMAGVIVVTNLKGGGSEERASGGKRPLVYALVACAANGLLNFMVKLQQYYTPGEGENTFYIVMYAGGGLVCLIAFALIRLIGERGAEAPKEAPKEVAEERSAESGRRKARIKICLTGLGVGICSAVCLYPQSLLTRYVSASVQFTVTASGAVLLSLLIAFFRYREKPNLKNIISTICCLLAIFLQLVV